MTQKEETFQVVLDLIKASPCYNAFLVTADVPEIYMHQLWFTVKKIKKITSYEFDLADKKCKVDVKVLRKILSICLLVPNEDFIIPPSEESLINFLYELGYKGQINKLASMFVDHMHQPWRALATIIKKCQSRKTSSNDRLRQSRARILWGMFNRKKVDFDTMLTDEIKQSEAYKAFIAYSTGLIPPKKPRGKSISKTEAEIAEEERCLHEIHEHLVTAKPTGVDEFYESDGEPAKRPTRKRSSGVAFKDTLNVSKKKSLDRSQKLKGIQVMTEKEQLATNTKKAIKARKEAFILQQQTEDSSEGAGITPEVLDDLTGKFTTLSEGAGTVLEFDEELVNEGNITWLSTDEEENGNEDDYDDDDDRSIDIEETNDERTDSENDDQAMTDADNIFAEKLEEE
nr:hypothetical protein [Tanacetum cinerariifolium]